MWTALQRGTYSEAEMTAKEKMGDRTHALSGALVVVQSGGYTTEQREVLLAELLKRARSHAGQVWREFGVEAAGVARQVELAIATALDACEAEVAQ